MSKIPHRRKYVVRVKTPDGLLERIILYFKPSIGAKLNDGSVVEEVLTP